MIVVGIDGSQGAARALRFAAEEASLRDTDLRMVAVWNIPAAYYAGEGLAPTMPIERFEESMRAVGERQAAEILAAYPDLTTELIIVSGRPRKRSSRTRSARTCWWSARAASAGSAA